MTIKVFILAAGQGKRMKSALPKVLHPLANKPLLEHVVATAQQLAPAAIHIIYGHQGEVIRAQLQHLPATWVEQTQQLGTGHAVMQGLPHINDNEQVLVLYGDVPLISVATLQELVAKTPQDGLGLVTAKLSDPTGLGRVIRANDTIVDIVEHKDATEQQRQINEIYAGIMLTSGKNLKNWLPQLKNHNAQQEYYLPEVVKLAVAQQCPVISVTATCPEEVQGVNDRVQLAALERYYQHQAAQRLMLSGVSLLDPQRFDLRGELQAGMDVVIDVNVIIEGTVKTGANCYIGPNTLLKNVNLGDNVNIKANCVIEDSHIADACTIGPFARLRPGTRLAKGARIGNFVEIKNSEIGENSTANHLSYIGDASIGRKVTIGAGTITCNYDGLNKHRTTIGDGVMIGSDTQLVAPVVIGDNATIGAGSTITNSAPADALTLTRVEPRSIKGWKRPDQKVKEQKGSS